VAAQQCDQPAFIPAWPGFILTRLEVVNLGAAHAAVNIQEQLDVERGVGLIRLGRQGRGGRPSQPPGLAGPVLAGDTRRR
jgi:hypothetical protein